MFNKLTDFTYKRNRKEAVGFYLAYLLLLMIIAGLCSAIFSMLFSVNSFEQGVRVGTVVAVLFVLFLSGLILKQKKLFKNYSYIILALIAGFLAFLGGGLLGLILPAYFTTKEPK